VDDSTSVQKTMKKYGKLAAAKEKTFKNLKNRFRVAL